MEKMREKFGSLRRKSLQMCVSISSVCEPGSGWMSRTLQVSRHVSLAFVMGIGGEVLSD